MQKDRYQWVLEWWGRARDDLETERETWRIKISLAGAQAATEFYNEVWEIGIPTEWDQSHYTSSILSFPVLDKTERDPKDMGAYEGMVALALTSSAQEGRARRGC